MRIIFLILFLLAYKSNNYKNKVINGELIPIENKELFNINNVDIIVKSNDKLCQTIRTDSQGHFQIFLPNDKSKKIDILYSGIGFGTVYLVHIDNILKDTIHLNIQIPVKYKINELGKVACPKCNKTDLTFKIIYGDNPIYTLQINKIGDTIYSAIHDSKYSAGTCVSTKQSAQWYCDRDKIMF
jgi:hypothetical protein